MGDVISAMDREYAEKMVEFLEWERTIPTWGWAARIEFKRMCHEKRRWIAEWQARKERIVRANPAPGFNYRHC